MKSQSPAIGFQGKGGSLLLVLLSQVRNTTLNFLDFYGYVARSYFIRFVYN
jgi:hypothetical protein